MSEGTEGGRDDEKKGGVFVPEADAAIGLLFPLYGTRVQLVVLLSILRTEAVEDAVKPLWSVIPNLFRDLSLTPIPLSQTTFLLSQLFIIAGPNGAGKTTASYTMLPELLNIQEFVNADEIARGISPFRPEGAAIEAGRIMLTRIRSLIAQNQDFAFETTLATKSFLPLVLEAKAVGYQVNLIYFWLDDVSLAIERVAKRVSEGGHNIQKEVIERRYKRGCVNFLKRYCKHADTWLLLSNSGANPYTIAEGKSDSERKIYDEEYWRSFNKLANDEFTGN